MDCELWKWVVVFLFSLPDYTSLWVALLTAPYFSLCFIFLPPYSFLFWLWIFPWDQYGFAQPASFESLFMLYCLYVVAPVLISSSSWVLFLVWLVALALSLSPPFIRSFDWNRCLLYFLECNICIFSSTAFSLCNILGLLLYSDCLFSCHYLLYCAWPCLLMFWLGLLLFNPSFVCFGFVPIGGKLG